MLLLTIIIFKTTIINIKLVKINSVVRRLAFYFVPGSKLMQCLLNFVLWIIIKGVRRMFLCFHQGIVGCAFRRCFHFILLFFLISGLSGYKQCTESFLFSLVNPSGSEPTKMPLKGTNNQNGICCSSAYGPIFGGGHDLCIANGANANSNSYSNLGNSYEYPPHANVSFLVGQKNFTVSELEVFLFQATG